MESFQIVQLLDERIHMMNAIADSVVLAGTAISACDIDGLEERIRNQESLCSKIKDLDARLESLQSRQQTRDQQSKTFWLSVVPAENDSLRIAMGRLREAHIRVKTLNAVHTELLRRSRRTVRALAQAYQSVSSEIYSNPVSEHSKIEERV